MPFGFPSHQGLLAPLWRNAPARVSVLALWCGALAPDVVDGVASTLARGRPGQWLGHSLIGLFVVSTPVAIAMTWIVRALARGRLAQARGGSRVSRVAARIITIDESGGCSPASRPLFECASAWIGALSHVLFDLVSHEGSTLLWPWAPDPRFFPEAFYRAWFHVSIPGYPDYPIAPHFVAWALLSGLGAWMFFRWPPSRRRE
jgi:hypothetical protein